MSNEQQDVQSTQPAAAAAATDLANTLAYDDDEALGLETESLSMAEMEALYDETMRNFREGEVVRGSIVEITDDRVLVDIGYKSEGVVSIT
ncbi:MAG TPA: S1 RNA-binding domain-containing protein, partial [Candidatus Hydrogenedentes bacterium]|nr:S1 RNA-binding domain-containing protein [Candidatus Hydrogenedentota bacterium]